MTIKELIPLIDAKVITPGADLSKEVLCGYTCDLLSWVMANGQEGMAWVTVQIHMNVIAVASLNECPLVILTEDVVLQEAVLEKAKSEEICVCTTSMDTYTACGVLSGILETGEV